MRIGSGSKVLAKMENPLKMVRDAIVESVDIPSDRILTSSKLRDLPADSLEYQSMLLDLEEVTGIDAEEIDNLRTVGALVARMNGTDSYT